jgi:hypothetical protein
MLRLLLLLVLLALPGLAALLSGVISVAAEEQADLWLAIITDSPRRMRFGFCPALG